MIADLPDLLRRRAELRPDDVALDEIATGRSLSYRELDRRSDAAAGLLRRMGVREGDRVAVLCRNRAAFFELLFACARVGAVLLPLNWRMPAAELDAIVAETRPLILFHGVEDAACAGLLDIAMRVDLDTAYEQLIASSPPLQARERWPSDGLWYLLYTSGTTGRPKGVIYTFGMALANQVNIGSAVGLRAGDRTASFLPLFHTAGINLHALPTLFQGGRVLVLPGFDADSIVALIEAQALDTFFGVPAVYQALLEHPRFAAAPLAGIRHWGCGGAPLPDEVARRCRAIGIRLCNGMGMTETGPTAFLADPADAWERIGSVGKPQLLCNVRLVDEALRDVADGSVGEVLFSGPGVTPGYWNDAEATRAAFTPDGWLRSGDLAFRDPEGFYHVVGRLKEMFISGGENVYPAEVENVLASHPAIAEAAVIGVPDPRWGEVGHAFLLPGSRHLPPAAAEIDAFCRARLAAYKVPVRFEWVADFPRTPAGKIQKHLLDADRQASDLHCAPTRHKQAAR